MGGARTAGLRRGARRHPDCARVAGDHAQPRDDRRLRRARELTGIDERFSSHQSLLTEAGMIPRRGREVVSSMLVALMLYGCSSMGPGTVPRDRVDYANALSDSWKDQMLLNIVRLRYADTPTFMDVSSVIAAYTIQIAGSAGAAGNIGVSSNSTTLPNATASVGVAGGYNDRPTISYTPLTGAKFAKSLLQPIPPEAIFSLISAGYPA